MVTQVGKEISTGVSLSLNMLQRDIPIDKMDKMKNVE